jgi:dipeptidase
MKTTPAKLALLLCFIFASFTFGLVTARDLQECTTLVAAGGGTTSGGPLLWKNRDTDTLSNKVVFVEEQPYSYLALVNAEDTSGRIAWAGLNAAGFGIANSVAYNLPQAAGEEEDLEGYIMADALRTCGTIAEFEQFLAKNLNRNFGARTNFLAIDAQGGAAIFETHNHGFKRLDAATFPGARIANTNFSRSGAENAGAGYLRFDRESTLLESVKEGTLDVTTVLQGLARDLGHALLRHPARAEWAKLPASTPHWVHTNYTINRASTASAVVIQGVRKGEDPARATMWVALGEPVTTLAVPLWVAAGTPPEPLWQGKDAPMAIEAFRLKDRLRPLKARERREYADLTRLDNADGTGWLPSTLAIEREIIAEAEALLKKNPSATELAAFQKAAAEKALAALKRAGRSDS